MPRGRIAQSLSCEHASIIGGTGCQGKPKSDFFDERTVTTKMTHRTITVFAGICMLAAGALPGETRGDLKATIPFAFAFGNEQMPAGEYVIAESPTGGVMMTSKDGKIRRHAAGIPMEFPNRESRTRLVFRRHGTDYFLAQVWVRTARWAREIPVSKTEREVIARTSQQRDSEQIAVSAQ